jgi:hypothetical protein
MRFNTILLFAFVCAVTPIAAAAQDTLSTSRPLRVFLDCEDCDFDHLRREIRFVDYVRQPADAELHVLVTTQQTGAGGDRFSFFFIGQGRFAGRQDTLLVTVAPDATDSEERDALTNTLALGLVSYAARTELAPGLRIGFEGGDDEREDRQTPVNDPWNLWVFRTGLNTTMQGESTRREFNLEGSLSASRTTEILKMDFGLNGDYSQEKIEGEDEDEEDLTIVRREYSGDALVVRSLGPHLSAGLYLAGESSSRLNQDLSVELSPAIEYNVYPYDESSRRQILFTYRVGPYYANYEEVTLFGRTSEVLGRQALEISAAIQQPWGEMNGSLEGSNFFHDFGLHRIELFTGMDVRLFRGFSLDVEGSVARIKDQIYLRAAGLTPEEILLGLRERGTDYEYEIDIGFSYSFGSVFNNVVNPRLRLNNNDFDGR